MPTRCEACGFTYEDVPEREIGLRLRDSARAYRAVIGDHDDATARRRPEPATWSPLAYCCHMRDVVLAIRERTFLALAEDDYRFPPMYRELRAEHARYADQDIEEVLEQLALASVLLAQTFEALSDEQLARTCTYNFPEPTERTIAWVARHAAHEAYHHLLDVERSLSSSVLGDLVPFDPA